MIKKLYLIPVILLAVIMSFSLVKGIQKLKLSNKETISFHDFSEKDVVEGSIVEGNLYYNFGPFENKYEIGAGKKSKNHHSFIIPVGNVNVLNKYMGLMDSGKKMQKQLIRQSEQTFSYLDEERSRKPAKVYIKGRLYQLSDESKANMKESLDYIFDTEQSDAYITGYYIKCEEYDDYFKYFIVAFLALILGIGICYFCKEPHEIKNEDEANIVV